MKFIKNIGNASTSAWINGERIGHNVNAALYIEDEKHEVRLENNGESVKGVEFIAFNTPSEYGKWEDSKPEGLALMLHALRLFGCETGFDTNINTTEIL